MAFPVTYIGWIDLLKEWIDVEDLSNSVFDTCLSLAQERLNRDLNSQYMEAKANYTVPDPIVPIILDTIIPDFNRLRLLFTSQSFDPLEVLPINEFMKETAQNEQGQACFYAIESGELLIGPSIYPSNIVYIYYYLTVPHLSDTVATNVFSLKHPDLLLHASCVEISKFIVEDERIATWNTAFTEALDSANLAAKNYKLGATPLKRKIPSMGV